MQGPEVRTYRPSDQGEKKRAIYLTPDNIAKFVIWTGASVLLSIYHTLLYTVSIAQLYCVKWLGKTLIHHPLMVGNLYTQVCGVLALCVVKAFDEVVISTSIEYIYDNILQ